MDAKTKTAAPPRASKYHRLTSENRIIIWKIWGWTFGKSGVGPLEMCNFWTISLSFVVYLLKIKFCEDSNLQLRRVIKSRSASHPAADSPHGLLVDSG